MSHLAPVWACLLPSVLAAQVFGPVESLPQPDGSFAPVVAALGDLDHDGAPDLVLLDSARLTIQLGVGSSSPVPAFRVAPTLFFGGGLQLVDGDGDGNLDIWVGHAFGALELRGDGNGAFPTSILHPINSRAFQVVDVDEDQIPDFAYSDVTGVHVALGQGAGSFADPVLIPGSPVSQVTVVAADFDADGHLDLAVLSGLGAQLQLLRGDGSGQFVGWGAPLHAGLLPGTMLAADLDGDGRSDLVTVTNIVLGWINQGGGTFGAPINLPQSSSIAAIDVDADGNLDLVETRNGGVAVAFGNGAGSFTSTLFPLPGNGAAVAAGDVDGNGRIDVVTADATTVMLLRNQLATPPGIAPFGHGTPGCAGTIGLWGAPEPAIGENDFHVICSNAPGNAVGLLAIGTRVTAGWDPLGLDLTLHLGFALPVATMRSDPGGSARHLLPIPALPFLAGLRVCVQSVWLADPGRGDSCSAAQYDLASSRGLSITLQP
jgi:FG-GAP-like repeat